MTKEETIRIVRVMSASYPNYKPQFIEDVVSAWEMMFSEFPYEIVAAALKTYIATDTSGFAPSIGAINKIIQDFSDKASDKKTLTGNEAWAIVMKAICRGNYHAKEDFENMPEIVQRAVGSWENIKALASDSSFNEGVEKSHFIRIYDRVVEDNKTHERIPKEVRELIGGVANGNDRIGNPTKLVGIEEQG